MSGFVQVVEWSTARFDEVRALNDEWRDRFPATGPNRILVCKDRTRENSYLTIVEFGTYEQAMQNSADPVTSEFAERLRELCDSPPVFHDLDVLHTEMRSATTEEVAPG